MKSNFGITLNISLLVLMLFLSFLPRTQANPSQVCGYNIAGVHSVGMYYHVYGSWFNLSNDAHLTKMFCYIANPYSNDSYVECAIYLKSDYSLIATTAMITIYAYSTPSWRQFTFNWKETNFIDAGEVILVFWNINMLDFYYDTGVTNQGCYEYWPYWSWPTPLVPEGTNNCKWSIYFTYETVAWYGVEKWTGSFSPLTWYGVEKWTGRLTAFIATGFHLAMIKDGLFIAGLCMFFVPLFFVAMKKKNITAEQALNVLLVMFVGIGLLIGFAYMEM